MPEIAVKKNSDWEMFEEDWVAYCEYLDQQRDEAEMDLQYEYAKKEGLLNAAS
jgi:hypothetical protein